MARGGRRKATYEQLVAVPDSFVAEIVDGELYASPRPRPRHVRAASALGGLIGGPFDFGRAGSGGWWILDEPELHLGEHVLVPDLAGWRRERMTAMPQTAWFDVVPDWVCEVLSPQTADLDRDGKLPVYAGAGVAHLWLVDPALRTLEAYRLEGGVWSLVATHADDAQVGVEPFDSIALDLGRLWEGTTPAGGGRAG